jgi:hypothetical protein
MTIEQRMERLERQNRHLRWMVGGMLGLAVTGLVLGAAASSGGDEIPNVLRAHRVEVITPDGKPAVVLGMTTNDAGTVSTMDSKGNKLVTLGVTTNGEGTVTTQNDKGKDLVRVAATTSGEGVVITHNGRSDKLIELGVTTKGEPKIYAYKADGSPKAWP